MKGLSRFLAGGLPWPWRWRSRGSGSAPSSSAQAGHTRGDRGGQGDSDVEERERDVSSAVPGMVERTKTTLLQSNLNYQKDLNEVALIVAKSLAGREKRDRRRHGEDLCQRVHRAGVEGPRHLLQVAAGPEAD